MKFDIVISNPPYSNANDITTFIVRNVKYETYINLMPISKYKNADTKLYQYVDKCEQVSDIFEDAHIGNVLSICQLKRTAVNRYTSFTDLEMEVCDKKFLKFYKKNNTLPYTFECIYRPNTLDGIDFNKAFLIPNRAADHGVNISGGAYEWNVNKQYDPSNIFYDKTNKRFADSFYVFQTQAERDNFLQFWYMDGRHGLMHKLLKGLNKNGGNIDIAVPHIDWTHTWTAEEVLNTYEYKSEEIYEIIQKSTVQK